MPQWEYSQLSYDGNYINYITYQADSPYRQQKLYNDAIWSWCLNTLGLIGWEATGTVGTPTEIKWYFKRMIDPSNSPLQL